MNKPELVIGYVLRIGLWLSVIVVLIGGIWYLMQNGHQIVSYHIFQENEAFAAKGIWGSFSWTAQGLIQLGLLILISTQILRVALIAWLFAAEHDLVFALLTGMILAVLIYSIFLRV